MNKNEEEKAVKYAHDMMAFYQQGFLDCYVIHVSKNKMSNVKNTWKMIRASCIRSFNSKFKKTKMLQDLLNTQKLKGGDK